MLQAGAKTAYYMEVLDTHLQEAFESLLALIPASSPVVIESPALRNLVIPGVFFILDHPQTLNKKMDVLSWAGNADQFINTGIENLSAVIEGVHFDNGEWQYRT